MKKYKVKIGDSLGSIAKRFYKDTMKYIDIAETNNISGYDVIAVGQNLILPGLFDAIISTKETVMQEGYCTSQVTGQFLDNYFTSESLNLIIPNARTEDINYYLKALNSEMLGHSINTPLRLAHFIAQLAYESGCLKYSAENLNYSANTLKINFKEHFPNYKIAEEYANNPDKIANRIYANKMKNGDEESGDGWNYRGRGLFRLTGKDNYAKCGEALKTDLINKPDLLAVDANVAAAAACWFWKRKKLNTFADKDNIMIITRLINGDYNGLEERKKYLKIAKTVLGI